VEFDVFGSRIIVERIATGWAAFYPAEEGKRRPAHWLLLPPELTESQIARYLADYCHEGASPEHPDVKRLR
jgi:hypothetical protein